MNKQYTCKYDSDIGDLTLLSDGENLTGLWMKYVEYMKDAEIIEIDFSDLPVFKDTCRWLDGYFQGKKPSFIPPIKMEGTPFRKEVWNIIAEIPYGKVITYGDIAKKIALRKGIKKMSSQAVGGAVGSNPVSIIIPCHRVVGLNGNLTGYGGGLDIKVKLMTLEGMDMNKFYMPSK